MGFDRQLFAAQLSRVTRIRPSRAAQYGVTVREFENVQERTLAWAIALRDEASGTRPDPVQHPITRERPIRNLDSGHTRRPEPPEGLGL